MEEQELLRASARRFLENECPSAFVRQRMAEPEATTEAFWQRLAAQGWFGIIFPKALGGSGLGLVDMVVLMEEMGRAVMPGPFFFDGITRRRDDPRGGLPSPAPGMAGAHYGR